MFSLTYRSHQTGRKFQFDLLSRQSEESTTFNPNNLHAVAFDSQQISPFLVATYEALEGSDTYIKGEISFKRQNEEEGFKGSISFDLTRDATKKVIILFFASYTLNLFVLS